MRPLSNAAKQALYAQQSSEVFIILLTISHPSFTEDVRISSDPMQVLTESGVRGVLSRGLEYPYLPFSISLPQMDDTGTSRASISIDNIDRRMVAAVRSANSSLRIKIEIVLASDVDNVEISMDDYRLERVTYDAFSISGDISIEYFDLEPYPSKRFTPSDFPGIF